jgi:Zn-dependent peptidase ImmA (M78 family)
VAAVTSPASANALAERLLEVTARTPGVESDLIDALDLPDGMPFEDALKGHSLSTSDLIIAAEILSVPVTYLAGQTTRERNLSVALRLGQNTGKAPAEVLSFADKLLSHYALIDSWLGPELRPLSGIPVSNDSFKKRAGETTAARVRDAIANETGPISDLVELAELCGVPVVFMPLPDHISGLTVKQETAGIVRRLILINTRERWARQRYTLAHELCHALYLDGDQYIVDFTEESGEHDTAGEDVHRASGPEVRAEYFARHLIFPRAAARSEIAQVRRLRERWELAIPRLMLTYGISRDALLRTLVADELVSSEEAGLIEQMRVEDLMARSPWIDQWNVLCEEQQVHSGSPWLVKRALDAYDRQFVSTQVVADLMLQDDEATERQLRESGRPVL